MKHLTRYLVLGIAVAMLVALIVPVMAQDKPQPGQGGIIVEGNFGGDPKNLNPIIENDTASLRIDGFLFPNFIGIDPATATLAKASDTVPALVKDWTISPDGKVYTFTLRSDWTWNDGTPITSKDFMYTWNVIVNAAKDNISTALVYVLDAIDKVEAPDDHTIVMTFKDATCTALNYALLPVVPSHVLPTDLTQLMDSPFNLNPTVTQGPFNFGSLRPGEQTSLTANQSYPGAINHEVLPEGFVYKNVADQTVLVEQFLAGETSVLDSPPPNRLSDVQDAATKGDVNLYTYPGNSWDYLQFNLGDPTNPQNATDDKGNPIDQGHHPLFSDVRVRKAIELGVNMDDILKSAYFGNAEAMTSVVTVPASWAYDHTLTRPAFDQAAAGKLLDEAGWIDDDNNPDTPRVAKGAMYAPDGTPFKFTLYTNSGNTRRGAIATIVQDELKQIGIAVDFQAIDFNTLLDIINGQTYDAYILGYQQSYPDDPDAAYSLFTPSGDVVGGGQNNGSYNNPALTEALLKGRTVPGCDLKERAKYYAEASKILADDLPLLPLAARNGYYAARSNVGGFAPYPSNLYWNVEAWYLKTP